MMAMKAIRKLPELQENQEWACDGGCDVIRPKHFENTYSETIAHDGSITKRLSEFYWTCQNNHLLRVWCTVKSDYALLLEENYIEEKLNIVESNSIQESIDLLTCDINSVKESFIENVLWGDDNDQTLEQLITKAMQLGGFYAERDRKTQVPEGFVLLPVEPTQAIKTALSYQCFDFIKVAQIYRDHGFDIPKKAENEQSFFLHKFLLLAIKHGNDFIKFFNAETKAMIEAQEHSQ